MKIIRFSSDSRNVKALQSAQVELSCLNGKFQILHASNSHKICPVTCSHHITSLSFPSLCGDVSQRQCSGVKPFLANGVHGVCGGVIGSLTAIQFE